MRLSTKPELHDVGVAVRGGPRVGVMFQIHLFIAELYKMIARLLNYPSTIHEPGRKVIYFLQSLIDLPDGSRRQFISGRKVHDP